MLGYISILLRDLDSNGLSLLTDVNSFSVLILVLIFQNIKFVVQASDNIFLTLNLRFIISLECCNAYVELFLSSLEVFDMGLQVAVVSFEELMRLNFCPVSGDDPVSDAVTNLDQLVMLAMLILNPLELQMLAFFPLLAMLLVKSVAMSGHHYGHV
jgi:hypothetical protein